jgi:tRNA-dihydrouridine synthase
LKIFEKFVRMEVAYKGERRAVLELRKHYRWYVRGHRGMKYYRTRLARTETLEGVMSILGEIREELKGK